ncbi:MAG TPA: TetR/AcrR family transcriptional regulator [Thermodesulfobacteriota bacterium]|nr:TetR/AcrR family transcriptional regulator [Thermodesulfobacteriota bacterium]
MPKEEKRTKIREAAARLFAEKGFENTTTRDIAGAAGINNASLYYYFDSKEQLLYQILEEVIRTGLERITEIEQSPRPLKEKLALTLRIHTTAAVDFDKMKMLVHDQRSLSPGHREELNQKQSEYVCRLIAILQQLRDQGEMLDLDLTVCAYAFFGMVSWAYRWYRPEGKVRLEELSDIFYTIFTRGIYRTREPRTKKLKNS